MHVAEGTARAPAARFGRPFTAPIDQSATFVELFFDLVFVFALTEVTALTLEHLDWAGAARSALVFWMIWWAWTQWTWALNPADTEHLLVRAGTLVATAVAFLMAASVHGAFSEDGGLWFVVPYVLVRVIGFGLYALVASDQKQQRSAVLAFGLASLGGLVVVIVGGFVDADARPWWWLAAAMLDVGAAAITGQRAGWDVQPAHFVERHGLFVIIALGESLVVVGLTVSDSGLGGDLLAVAIGAVVVTGLLWWTYFSWLQPALETTFHEVPPDSGGTFGRDVFSLLHFPLIGGVIGIAVGFEEMARHPEAPLEGAALVSLGAGLALFVGGAAAAWARATHRVLAPRLAVLALLLVTLSLAASARPAAILGLIALALAAITLIELRRHPTTARR